MPALVPQTITAIIDQSIDPVCGRSLGSLDAVSQCQYGKGKVSFTVTLGYPATLSQKTALSRQLWESLCALDEVSAVDVDIDCQIPANVSVDSASSLSKVRNIIAVASGKGGVGKSTTTANLALALAGMGARVGVLDADIYGPSQGMMLGTGAKRPDTRDGKIIMPHEKYRVKSMSMGYLVTDKTPMVWRGPMATGALQQMIQQTDWQDLDYLLVDMPPGTGDIALTLSQQVPVSGAVIVTTPQDIALLDAQKAVAMFNKVHVPVLGIVENMAVHQCGQCGYKEHVFGRGGGERMAEEYGLQLLGSLPLASSIREWGDSGKPAVIAEPDSDISHTYRIVAQAMAAELWVKQQETGVPEIVVSDD